MPNHIVQTYSRGEDLTVSQAKEMGLNIIKRIKKNVTDNP